MYNDHDRQYGFSPDKTQTSGFANKKPLLDSPPDETEIKHLRWLENQTQVTIANLLSDKEKMLQRIQQIEAEIAEADTQIASLRTTVSIFRKQMGIEPLAEREAVDPELNSKYAGKGLREALILFAQNNNGLINELTAIETLMKAGLYPNLKKARGSINATLNRESNPDQDNPIFRKLGQGLYQLLESSK